MRYTTGDPIEMTILRKTPLGYLVQIDEETTGLLFQSDVFSPVRIGEATDGYIKNIREDGKIDVSQRPQGFRNTIDEDCDTLIDALKAEQVLYFSDSSSPEAIKKRFNMSKKAFKKAVGFLYKQRVIVLQKDRIEFAPSKK